jgi:hypothetical protein
MCPPAAWATLQTAVAGHRTALAGNQWDTPARKILFADAATEQRTRVTVSPVEDVISKCGRTFGSQAV